MNRLAHIFFISIPLLFRVPAVFSTESGDESVVCPVHTEDTGGVDRDGLGAQLVLALKERITRSPLYRLTSEHQHAAYITRHGIHGRSGRESRSERRIARTRHEWFEKEA